MQRVAAMWSSSEHFTQHNIYHLVALATTKHSHKITIVCDEREPHTYEKRVRFFSHHECMSVLTREYVNVNGI